MFFLLLGAINAAEVNNVSSTDDTNLMVDTLSSNNIEDSNLEVSSDDNILNSNNDNEQLQASGSDVKTNVTKTSTAITVQNAHYSKSNTIFKVVLQDKSGNLLSNKKISLKINGKTYTNTTQSNGAAYITLPSLNKGTYKITANFYGDSKYKSSTFSGNKMVISSISDRKNLVKTYGVEKYFTATFWKDNARLANTNVKITLNGKTYTVKTDSKGVGKINTDLLPGKYTIKLYNPYAKETVTNSITVNKDSSNITATNEYILPNSKYSYSITLKTGKGEPIKNAKIQFNYNNEKVTSLTNANGEATTTIPALSKGTYTISYTYYGNTKYNSVSGSKKLFVRDSTTTLKTRDLEMQYNDGSAFGATVTDSSGKALANKTIKFTMNGKTVKATTNNYGTAILDLSSLKPDTYNIKTTYSSAGSKDYNTQTNKITVNKQSVTIVTSDLVMKYNSGSSFQATIKDKADKALSGIIVKFTIKGGNTYNITTNSNGIAKLPISGNVGEYTIYTQIVEGTYYTSSKVTNKILINGTKFQASDMTISENTAGTFSVKLVDGQGKPVISTVKFTLNNKVQSVQTDANGIAKLPISGLAKGTYTVTYTSGSFSGSSKINVINKVTLKEVITASQNVKKYIEANNELPKTVTIGGNTYSTAEYVYLASQAIINLNSNSKADIAILGVKSPTSPKNAENLGNLYDYLSVAKSVVNTAKSKGIMPDSVSSNVGTIGYNGLVYATARVVAFYGDYSIMPNYVAIKTYSASSSSSSLNSKNTITNLKPYLAASTNCQVGNSKIKSIVNSLTSGLTTDVAKAKAIYNYVRDAVSYSFYYNTRYGAVGTLNAKTGNCVDQAHLLIAMYRTAGLAARYVHGTCVFSSGSTYGHVWAQVLIGDTWTVVDATSTRNSFGNVVNWNNYNYNLHGYYSSIAF